MLNTRKNKFGLTLIELLVVTAMLAAVSLALFSTFSNGIELWQRINKPIPQEEAALFFDRFTRELSNCFQFASAAFIGDSDRLEFATMINIPGQEVKSVGKVSYSFDCSKGILNRRQFGVSEIFNRSDPLAQPVLGNIKSLEFKYYLYDKAQKKYSWVDEWTQEKIPLAVRVEFEANYAPGNNFIKTINIPVGE
jgi:hypothetical protein